MKTPRVSGKEILNALLKNGFEVCRQKGSHINLLRKAPEKTYHVTIPIHAGKDINPFVFKSIARQAGLTSEELAELL
ncbi:MAG: type II toxin-antitoxin system HicA family toxin [Candidatus Diapherotrites archaeon]|nr:type II toxin-antitoxin system HicA family toxin [Candidatus Diapherotrites archaeon]